jgi:hypothetical protein
LKDHQLLLLDIQIKLFCSGSSSNAKLAAKATGLVSELRMQLPNQKVVHVDEAGW